jgi:hypothetical protein
MALPRSHWGRGSAARNPAARSRPACSSAACYAAHARQCGGCCLDACSCCGVQQHRLRRDRLIASLLFANHGWSQVWPSALLRFCLIRRGDAVSRWAISRAFLDIALRFGSPALRLTAGLGWPRSGVRRQCTICVLHGGSHAAPRLRANDGLIENDGRAAIHAHEKGLLSYATQRLREINSLKIMGNARDKGAIISFAWAIHVIEPRVVALVIDQDDVAVRAGSQCAMLLHQRFGTRHRRHSRDDVDRLATALRKTSG